LESQMKPTGQTILVPYCPTEALAGLAAAGRQSNQAAILRDRSPWPASELAPDPNLKSPAAQWGVYPIAPAEVLCELAMSRPVEVRNRGRRDAQHMKPIEPPDAFHLQAAEGWLGLGDPVAAGAELEKIAPQLRAHAVVLNLRWDICAAAKKWETALEIAAALIQLDPDDPLGWVYRSRALHELKRTLEARDNLLGILDKFPSSVTVLYDLACYECKAGDLERAKHWLDQAFHLGRARPR
jgi:tetratricopeptide (TPR) repeat protein